jgi:chemotaxis protein MotB
MMEHGIGEKQITQVRGFADQRLRKLQDPLDPSNRRISLIVQYLDKKPAPFGLPTMPVATNEDAAKPDATPQPAASLKSESPAPDNQAKN